MKCECATYGVISVIFEDISDCRRRTTVGIHHERLDLYE